MALLSLPLINYAQNLQCATPNPDHETFLKNEHSVRLFKENASNRNTSIITIPVVVHVMHEGEAIGVGNNISDAQIFSAINNLNEAYAHTGYYGDGNHEEYNASVNIQFALAQIAPDGTATTGIDRVDVSTQPWAADYAANGIDLNNMAPGVDGIDLKNVSRWPNTEYLNIWLINQFENATFYTGPIAYAGTTGHAYFPGASSTRDGVIMVARGFGFDPAYNTFSSTLYYNMRYNGTLVHEIGHYLNLFHTFEGANGNNCPSVNNGCGDDVGDCCGDTPPHVQAFENCDNVDPNGNSCGGGGPNTYIHNHMNYTYDSCLHGFSNDQKTRMEAVVAPAGYRNAFASSVATQSLSGTYPPPACDNTSNYNTSYAGGPVAIELNGTTWYSQSGWNEDYEYLDRTRLQKTVELTAGQTYTIAVENGGPNPQRTRIYIDYNGDGDFNDINENVHYFNTTSFNHSVSFTVPSTGTVQAQRIRLRVISNVSSINSPCPDLYIGQVEDYSISILPSTNADGPLPIVLSDFKARIQNDQVLLQWNTLSEINAKGFQIQRKQSSENEFKTIAWQDALGGDQSTQQYQYTDNDVEKGQQYTYRLKMIDNDGAYEYSSLRSVYLERIKEVVVYPNPLGNDNLLHIRNEGETILTIDIYNTAGQLIQRQVLPIGTSVINMGTHPKGTYYYRSYSKQNIHSTGSFIVAYGN